MYISVCTHHPLQYRAEQEAEPQVRCCNAACLQTALRGTQLHSEQRRPAVRDLTPFGAYNECARSLQ